jgi:hypothetical protein
VQSGALPTLPASMTIEMIEDGDAISRAITI